MDQPIRRAVVLCVCLSAVVSAQETNQPTQDDETKRLCATAKNLANSLKPLKDIKLDVSPQDGLFPPDCYDAQFPEEIPSAVSPLGARSDIYYEFHWKASGLAHNPLYFEDVALERYGLGHSPVIQPVVSAVRFWGSAATLPYRIGLDSPHSLNYTLGYDRPGSHARSVREVLPSSWKGAALQAGTVMGGIYLFP